MAARTCARIPSAAAVRTTGRACLRVQRVAEPVLLNQLDAAAREAIMDALVNVDALQPTAD